MPSKSAQRTLFGVIFLACCALLGFGYYLQYVRHIDPCPLCMVQRLFFLATGLTALVAAMHGPGVTGARVYAAFVILWGIGGGATAARQVWLQHLPADRVPECGPGLEFILQVYPLLDALEKIVKGSGECAEVVWTFLSLSIPEWALIWFSIVVLAAATLWVKAGGVRGN